MNRSTAIKVQNLTKTYKLYDKPIDRLKESLSFSKKSYHKDFHTLANVSFEIKKGETVGILGSNGAGKSTLLKIITGVVTPTVGRVNVHGKIASLLELGAGFDPEMTGYKNIYLNGSIMGYSKSEIDSKIDEIIDFADIGDFIYQPMKVYSSGMFVRLAFATQIATNPDILIIDEALAVGDAYFVHKCMLHFHKLKEQGTTILLVTHDTTAIKTLCDSAVWLKNGSMEAYGDTTQVADMYLKYITNQQQYKCNNENTKQLTTTESYDESNSIHEEYIPNIDERFGDQGCTIIGFGLYDKDMIKTVSINNDSSMNLKLSFINNNVDENQDLVIGYHIRNNRGVDIASSNTEVEDISIKPSKIGEIKTILIEIEIPLLHPGSYSISTSIGYRKIDGKMRNLDSISNIDNINIESNKLVHVLMSLNTKYIDINEVNK
jgi:lipopolysaccharide transport system ATP-binding protein